MQVHKTGIIRKRRWENGRKCAKQPWALRPALLTNGWTSRRPKLKHSLPKRRSQECSAFSAGLYLLGVSKGGRPAPEGKVLVRAAREQRRQHHQVRQSEQPLLRLRTGRFRGSGDHAQVTAPREIVQMFDADARQAGHFRVREDFLTGLDFNQGSLSQSPPLLSPTLFDVLSRLRVANLPCNSRSVSILTKPIL